MDTQTEGQAGDNNQSDPTHPLLTQELPKECQLRIQYQLQKLIKPELPMKNRWEMEGKQSSKYAFHISCLCDFQPFKVQPPLGILWGLSPGKPRIPKFADTQVPDIRRGSTAYPLCLQVLIPQPTKDQNAEPTNIDSQFQKKCFIFTST